MSEAKDPDDKGLWEFLTSGPYYPLCEEERVNYATHTKHKHNNRGQVKPSTNGVPVTKEDQKDANANRPSPQDASPHVKLEIPEGKEAAPVAADNISLRESNEGSVMSDIVNSTAPPSVNASRTTSPAPEEDPGLAMEHKMRVLQRKNMVEYTELLPLPFSPPTLLGYIIDQTICVVMVAQYVITMLISLMTAQAEVTKFQERVGVGQLIYVILALYPVVTLTLLLVSFTEINIRKMIYYRMMSLGIILDWKDQALFKAWFMWYFLVSWIVVNVWTIYAASVATKDSGSPAFTCWVIVNMQTLNLFNFWRMRVVCAEEYLVTVSNFIERAPTAAKAMIENADVIREYDVARAILKLHKKLVAFNLQHPQDPDDSLFNLRELRRTKKIQYGHRVQKVEGEGSFKLADVKEQVVQEGGSYVGAFFKVLGRALEKLVFEKLYGTIFAFLVIVRRVRSKKLNVWPFPNDLPYFVSMAVLMLCCLLIVVGVEAYSLYLAVVPGTLEQTFGSSECRTCYNRLYASGKSCQSGSFCYASVAKTAYCLMSNLISGFYGMDAEAVVQGTCPAVLNSTLSQLTY